MFYFVPSWYSQDRPWYQEAPNWYQIFEKMTFDDTINHLKMFQTAKEDARVLLLNYQPQLRYFLHKQDLLATDYWSFFDDIQNISKHYTHMIDFKTLDWPKGTIFSYSSFLVLARYQGQLLAEINFGENGNLLTIQFFEQGLRTRRYVFDDRGFLSSILYFAEDEPIYQEYLNLHGVWQVREDFVGEKGITVNPKADRTYHQQTYATWEELMMERLTAFQKTFVSSDDKLVVASHNQHNGLVFSVFSRQDKILSFFGSRFDLSDKEALGDLVNQATLLVTSDDVIETALTGQIIEQGLTLPKMTRLSPFDTRLRLGRSQTVKELMICLFVDNLDGITYREVIQILIQEMLKNPLIVLKILSYQQDFPKEQVQQGLVDMIKEVNQVNRFMSDVISKGENQLSEDRSQELSAVSIDILTNENQLIQVLDTARLVLDLGGTPDLYTQIASLSAGVPQVNVVPSEYVSHGENGWVLKGLDELPQALDYYFDGLTNWNKSLVYTVQKMGDYTSGRMIDYWKSLLEE